MKSILVVCERSNNCAHIIEILKDYGYHILEAHSSLQGIDILRKQKNISFALLDSQVKDIAIDMLIKQLRSFNIYMPLILLVNKETNEKQIEEWMSLGANDFLFFDDMKARIGVTVQSAGLYNNLNYEISYYKGLKKVEDFSDIVAESPAMRVCLKTAMNAAKTSKNLYIEGEVGSGRERLAHIIHKNSFSKKGPFILVHCLDFVQKGSLRSTFVKNSQTEENQNLSEYFDDSKDWSSYIKRIIEKVENGTLCLFEIELLTAEQQNILYALLQKHLGKKRKNFQVISISQISGEELVTKRQFSLELMKMLNELRIFVPALRQRREDLPKIAEKLLYEIVLENARMHHIKGLSGAVIAMLSQHDWQGNIYELEKVLYRAIIFSNGPLLKLKDFPHLIGHNFDCNEDTLKPNTLMQQIYLNEDGHIKTFAQVERELIETALKRYNRRMSEISRRLDLGRSTLYRKLEEYKEE